MHRREGPRRDSEINLATCARLRPLTSCQKFTSYFRGALIFLRARRQQTKTEVIEPYRKFRSVTTTAYDSPAQIYRVDSCACRCGRSRAAKKWIFKVQCTKDNPDLNSRQEAELEFGFIGVMSSQVYDSVDDNKIVRCFQ